MGRRKRSVACSAARHIQQVRFREGADERDLMKRTADVRALAGKAAKRDTKIAFATSGRGDLALANDAAWVEACKRHSATIRQAREDGETRPIGLSRRGRILVQLDCGSWIPLEDAYS